jgi:hypothetical protein
VLKLQPVSGGLQAIRLGDALLPVSVRVTNSATPPNPVMGARVTFQSMLFLPNAPSTVDVTSDPDSGISQHPMRILLGSSQATPVTDANGLVYKRECQEHFYPCAGGASLVRDFQPLSPKKTLVWCRALGCSISAAASFLVATTPISFETESSRALYGVNHGSI